MAIAGGLVSGALPGDVLLGIVAVTLLYFGVDLLRRPPQPSAEATGERAELDLRAAALAGALIGFIGGVVGLILGSLRMPALLRYVGETARAGRRDERDGRSRRGSRRRRGARAVRSSTGTCSGLGAAASIPGALLGARLTGRLSEAALLRAVALVLVVAGCATGVQAVA